MNKETLIENKIKELKRQTKIAKLLGYLDWNWRSTEIEKLENQPLNRIADALEEILRLVKKDQEESKKRWEKESE